MNRNWTFGQKIATGFGVMLALTLVIAGLAIYALRTVVDAKDRVIGLNALLVTDAQKLATELEKKGSAGRGYLIAGEDRFLEQMRDARKSFDDTFERLTGRVYTDDGKRLLEEVGRAETAHQAAVERTVALRRGNATPDAISRAFDDYVIPARTAIDPLLASFLSLTERLLQEARQAATDTATQSIGLVFAIGVMAVLGAILIAFVLTRALGRQIGTAVGQVQTSSTQLQSAATQQATGVREQATALNQITTTMRELMASSRQIADSARHVAEIAEQTASASRSGTTVVDRAQDSISGIRRQVDLIVVHMLELGKKSQQIGAVLDIVSELAEQTNILAINATIEAAGAGEAGRRFAIVADEIRKLADRVTGSTKEIRALIDDVRGAVNTTVMATEGGSKSVDAGTRQFTEVADAFKQIVGMVITTTQAAKEIELSTKQQTSAVEQINIGISNVAEANKETEASSGQTLETVSMLAGLSRDLLRVVRPQAMT
jgi:methyl-accepting chemotaxis protein